MVPLMALILGRLVTPIDGMIDRRYAPCAGGSPGRRRDPDRVRSRADDAAHAWTTLEPLEPRVAGLGFPGPAAAEALGWEIVLLAIPRS